MTTRTHRTAGFTIALAAALAVFALAAPLAQAAPTIHRACTQPSVQSPYLGWVSVTDDQGVPWLYPVGYAPGATQTCTAADPAFVSITQTLPAAATTVHSPYAGWVIVTDEQGVPWLEPVEPISTKAAERTL